MRALCLAALFILLDACGTYSLHSRGNDGIDERAIAAATATWVAAYNSRDPRRIADIYDRDAVFWGTTSATIRRTPSEIFEYFKDAAKHPEARVAITDQHIRFSGDMAFSSGSYLFTDVRDSKQVENPSRFTFVFRMREGRWAIVHHHSSRVPAP